MPITLPQARIARLAGLAIAGVLIAAGAAAPEPNPNPTVELVRQQADRAGRAAVAWYRGTPRMERVAWGGLAACVALAGGVLAERSLRLRRSRIIPRPFLERFHRRLVDGQLDRGKALDYCELNASPAARIALAAVRRWGRPASELERAVALARKIEADRLRRNIRTLHRVAAIAPLIGLLGALTAAARILAAQGTSTIAPAWGPTLAAALGPLTAGVGLAILALVAYDGLIGRLEMLINDLDWIGAEAVDAIATATATLSEPHLARPRPDAASSPRPHPTRNPMPDEIVRRLEREREP